MGLNPMQLMGLRSDLEKFKNNHPKFVQFIQAMAQNGLEEGTVLECKVITPQGQEIQANIKLTAEDMELFKKLKDMA